MKNKVRCELLTWGEINRLARRLARLVQTSGYHPDIIIAIARGGYVPARLVCDFLDIYNLTSIRVAHYAAGSHKQQTARLSSPLNIDVHGLRVLIVDDVSDTGDTLQVTLEHVHSFNPAEVKIGVLHHKIVSDIEPDFYAKKITKWRWLIYPWAITEDLCGFIAAMEPPPKSITEAGERLKIDHGINASQTMLKDAYALLPPASCRTTKT